MPALPHPARPPLGGAASPPPASLPAAAGTRPPRSSPVPPARPSAPRRRWGLMLARVMTFAVDGVDARRVWVEADIRLGLPAFTVVGLADKAVREARERVRAAMVNSGYEFPLRRITVNLAPAYLRKVGPAFDLPLAVALLVASDQLEPRRGRGLRGRRRALADGRGAGDPRRARGRRGRPARASCGGSCCRARGPARRRSCPTSRSSASTRWRSWSRRCAATREPPALPDEPPRRGRAGGPNSPTSAATTG